MTKFVSSSLYAYNFLEENIDSIDKGSIFHEAHGLAWNY